jgi:uncharacterized protein YdaU (DUF1376 family)
MKDPAFLFYTKDFQSGTQDMSCCEVGAYIRLLMYHHQHGFIPKNVERLMRITSIFDKNEFDNIWIIVSKKFETDPNKPDQMVNHKLKQVVDHRAKYQPKKIAAAVLAGLISSSKVTNEQKEIIKKSFKINDFVHFSESEIKEKIREWFNEIVNHMVNYLVNEDANEDANEDVNEKNSKKEKKSKSKSQILPSFYTSLVEVIDVFNDVTESRYEPNVSLYNNFEYWLGIYSIQEIKTAIKNIRKSKWWAEHGTPTILLRRKNPNGENVDHIGSLLNIRETTQEANTINSAVSYISKL